MLEPSMDARLVFDNKGLPGVTLNPDIPAYGMLLDMRHENWNYKIYERGHLWILALLHEHCP